MASERKGQMKHWFLVIVFLAALAGIGWSPCQASDRDIHILIKQGRGTSGGPAAWERIGAGGPRLLPPFAKAIETGGLRASHWLRTPLRHSVATGNQPAAHGL